MPFFIQSPFVNYRQARRIIPSWLWLFLRVISITSIVFILACLSLDHTWAKNLLWGVAVPSLPLLLIVAPGLWRNLCPLAAINQLPQTLRLSLQWKLPRVLKLSAFAFAGIVFVLIIVLRPVLFEPSNQALLILLATFAGLALLGGILFNGKSGWCGTFCPLAPLQKVYGQAPMMVVPNSFCNPCVGCQKNCYDFNPRPSLLEDINDGNKRYALHRHAFLGLLPGLIFGFFSYRGLAEDDIANYFRMFSSMLLLSGGGYFLLLAYLPISNYRLALSSIYTCLGIFYWFSIPILSSSLASLADIRLELAQDSEAFMGGIGKLSPIFASVGENLAVLGEALVGYEQPIRFTMLLLLVACGAIALSQEARFNWLKKKGNSILVGNLSGLQKSLATNKATGKFKIFENQSRISFFAKAGHPILEPMEETNIPIESGCHMGICGSDPIAILEGVDNVEPVGNEERNTLIRLGLLGKARMACMMKVRGSVEISLDLSHSRAKSLPTKATSTSESFSLGHIDANTATPSSRAQDSNKNIKVVVIGNGVAGSSAVQFTRMLSPYCKISQVSAEPYNFYNRMGLGRLIYGRSGMQSLFLLKEDWFDKNKVDLWLNTFASRLELKSKNVLLSTGQRLPYDHLILALGSQALAPPFEHIGGVFTMRSADEAIAVRKWAQEREARRAVVVGGGLQGVETALALKSMGLQVALVHRSTKLVNRHADMTAARLLHRFLVKNGIEVILQEDVIQITDNESGISEVILRDKPPLATDICVFSIGVIPQIRIAQEAGLMIEKGAIAVTANMQTSQKNIYAVGDCARWEQATTSGLWGIGLEMGRIAAHNMLGFNKNIDADIYNTPYILKVPNFNLVSFGRIDPLPSDRALNRKAVKDDKWWNILINNKNQIVGGIFVNHNEMAMEVRRASREKADASTLIPAA